MMLCLRTYLKNEVEMISSYQISQLNKQRISVVSEKNSCFERGKNEIYYFHTVHV